MQHIKIPFPLLQLNSLSVQSCATELGDVVCLGFGVLWLVFFVCLFVFLCVVLFCFCLVLIAAGGKNISEGRLSFIPDRNPHLQTPVASWL